MAEQTSHNVVINSESTSASALVDAAANNSTTASAASGTTTTTSSKILSDTISAVGSAVKTVLPNGTTSEQTGSKTFSAAAEPSAGEAGDQPAIKAPGSQAVASDGTLKSAHGDLVNGTHEDSNQADGHADDKSITGGSVDLNVNSDTDNSRVDAGEKNSRHARTTSTAKKPVGFSKVNATKSFLSKIAPTAPTAPQAGDKRKIGEPNSIRNGGANKHTATPASATLQPANRPRLIAKTGASQSMLKPRIGSAGPGAPDASKVWNKNQPVVAPPPKQLTDEELKQQFGIHLATRLQTDGDKKDSNWADIDDDEDDWAPETVVWMDGTKSTVPKDPTPVPGEEEQKPATQPAVKTAESVKPALALKQRSDRPERPMQILKPGATAMQARQNGGLSGTSSVGQKASLTAKSPAAAPAKSPWAPVPKPDTVAPINPPVQAPPAPRALPSQDARASEAMAPPPAREIAADTFDRSWQRESGARELFNSSNGRYEPAPEGRRGSIRQDNSRKPAVLQRPTQTLSPAPEPSPAFQSRSSSQMDGSWGSRRRRDSSASLGSMPGRRRVSVSKASEFAATPEVPPTTSERATNPVAVRPNFHQQSAWDQQVPPPPDVQQEAPAAQVEAGLLPEDPVKVQERIMQEKREAAKRRKEEEAREEAAKQERLKAKLAALEGAGKSRSERAAEAAAKTTAEKPASASEIESSSKEPHPAKQPASTSASSQSPAIVETPAPAQQSPEKPAAPLQPQGTLSGLATQTDQSPTQTTGQRAPPARAPFNQQQHASAYRAPTSSYSSPGERKSQPAPLGRSPGVNNDAFSPWPSTSNSNSNIWGSGFGNGVFEGGSAFAPMATSQQNSSLPPPPGMSRAPGSARISPQGFNQDSRSPSIGQPQVSEQQRAFPAPGMNDRPAPFGSSQSRLPGVSPSQAPGYGRPHHPPGPIGPPSRAQHHVQNQQQQPPVQRPHPPAPEVSPWTTAADRMPNGQVPSAPLPEHRFKETFKKTASEQSGKLGAPRKYDAAERTVHDGSGSKPVAGFSPAPPSTQTQPIAPPPPAASPAQDVRTDVSNGSTVRIPDPSQNPSHGGLPRPIAPPHRMHAERLRQQRMATAPVAPNVASKEQFAPPPEVESHPVYSGDARHPQVRLPKPQAKVRLPPAPSQVQSLQNGSVVMSPQRQPYRFSPPGAVQPIVDNENWQQRFNGLFGRAHLQTEAPPSPPKTPPKSQGVSLAVASSSIEPMATQTTGATVSLPQGKNAQRVQTIRNLEPTSKPEVNFDNERSFGSLPKINVPSKTQYHPDAGSLSGPNLLKMKYNGRSVDSGFHDQIFFWRNPAGIFVNVPFTRLNNKLCVDPNYVAPPPKPARNERKPYQQRDQQILGREQQQYGSRDRKHARADQGQSGPGSRKGSQAIKNAEQQQVQGTEDRKASGKFANKKPNDRDNRDARKATATQDARINSTPVKSQSAASSKRPSVQPAKEQKPQTPPANKTAPMSAKEATTEKRKSGVSKPAGTPSASANRFELLGIAA